MGFVYLDIYFYYIFFSSDYVELITYSVLFHGLQAVSKLLLKEFV